MTELDALMEQLGKRRFQFHSFQTNQHGPEVLAAILDTGTTADVLILHDETHAVAYRTPTGPGMDVLAPTHVFWSYASSPIWTLRALLTLPPPNHPNTPTLPHIAEPNLGLLPHNRIPVRIRMRG